MSDGVVIAKFQGYFVTHATQRVKFLLGTPDRRQWYLDRITADRHRPFTEGHFKLVVFSKRSHCRHGRPFEGFKRVIFFTHAARAYFGSVMPLLASPKSSPMHRW